MNLLSPSVFRRLLLVLCSFVVGVMHTSASMDNTSDACTHSFVVGVMHSFFVGVMHSFVVGVMHDLLLVYAHIISILVCRSSLKTLDLHHLRS